MAKKPTEEQKEKKNNCCPDCKYYKHTFVWIPRGPIGECHRFPAEVRVYTKEHWCGEFKKRSK